MQPPHLGSPGGEAVPPGAVRPATALLRAFIDVSEEFERALGAELEVNATDLQLMEHLIMSGPLGPSELARRVGISAGSATTAIDRLVGIGHVSREAHPHDRRGVVVVPNDRSRDRAMSRIMPMVVDIDAELDGFSAQEQDTITRYLEGVVARLGRHVAISSAETAATS